jgi:hypothetical protein
MTQDQLDAIFELDFLEENNSRVKADKAKLTDAEKDAIRRSVLCSIGTAIGATDTCDIAGTGLQGQPRARLSPGFVGVVRALKNGSPICHFLTKHIPGDFWQFISHTQVSDPGDGSLCGPVPSYVVDLNKELISTISIGSPETDAENLPDAYASNYAARNMLFYAIFFEKAIDTASGGALHDALTAPQLAHALNCIKVLETDAALRTQAGLNVGTFNLKKILENLTDEDFRKLEPYLKVGSSEKPALDGDVRKAILKWAFFRSGCRKSLDADQLVEVLNGIQDESECALLNATFGLHQTTCDVLRTITASSEAGGEDNTIEKLFNAEKLTFSSDLREEPRRAILQYIFFHQGEGLPTADATSGGKGSAAATGLSVLSLTEEHLLAVADRIACSEAKLLPNPDSTVGGQILDATYDPYGLNQTMGAFVDRLSRDDARTVLQAMWKWLSENNDSDASDESRLRNLLTGGEHCRAPSLCAMVSNDSVTIADDRQWWSHEKDDVDVRQYKPLFNLIEKARIKGADAMLAAFLQVARGENADDPISSLNMFRLTRMVAIVDLNSILFPVDSTIPDSLIGKALMRTADASHGSLFPIQFLCFMQLIFFGFLFAAVRAKFYLVCCVMEKGNRAIFFEIMSATLSSQSTAAGREAVAAH